MVVRPAYPMTHSVLTLQRLRTKLTLGLEMDSWGQISFNQSWYHCHSILLEG